MYEIQNYHNNTPAYFHTYDNCYISNFLKQGEVYEKDMHDVFEKYVKKDFVVLEGGCHIGTHSIKLGKLCKKLYCFEPLPTSYDLLIKNVQENNLTNVKTFKNALSDNATKVFFNWVLPFNPGASGLHDNPMGNINSTPTDIQVETLTIDSLNLSELDFIKLDVEGYELKALKGGIETIKKFKPIITLECWENHQGYSSLTHTQTIFKEIIDLGYSVSSITYNDYLFLPL